MQHDIKTCELLKSDLNQLDVLFYANDESLTLRCNLCCLHIFRTSRTTVRENLLLSVPVYGPPRHLCGCMHQDLLGQCGEDNT
ncbi:hypothetical protein BST61_g10463 [Cercospora zeina]